MPDGGHMPVCCRISAYPAFDAVKTQYPSAPPVLRRYLTDYDEDELISMAKAAYSADKFGVVEKGVESDPSAAFQAAYGNGVVARPDQRVHGMRLCRVCSPRRRKGEGRACIPGALNDTGNALRPQNVEDAEWYSTCGGVSTSRAADGSQGASPALTAR